MKINLYHVRKVKKSTEEVTKMNYTLECEGLPPVGTIVMIPRNPTIGGLVEVYIKDTEDYDAILFASAVKKRLKKFTRPGWEKTKEMLRSNLVEVEIRRYHIRGVIGEGWAETRAYCVFYINNTEVLGDLSW